MLHSIVIQYPAMQKSVSNIEIENILPGAKCIAYKTLQQIGNLDKYLDAHPYVFVLYEYKPGYGHWTLPMRQGGDNEFFDSYGSKPDELLSEFDSVTKNRYGLNYPKIANLLLDSGKPVQYNALPLQRLSDKVQTCGKWCVIRALTDSMNVDDFGRYMCQARDPDAFVNHLYRSLE